jgi:hypothetical protein
LGVLEGEDRNGQKKKAQDNEYPHCYWTLILPIEKPASLTRSCQFQRLSHTQ